MLFRVFILASLIGFAGCGGCSSGGFPPDAAGADAAAMGSVTLAWSLSDLDGQPIQCDQVGANTVALQIRNRSTLTGVAASFSCKNSPSTQALAAGSYDISFELNGVGGTLATAPGQNTVMVFSGEDTPLTPVTFMVDAKGGVMLKLAVPSPLTSICKGPPMGAGVTGMTITLVHTGGGCAPVTFLRSGGSTTTSYVVNCSSPMIATCIEDTETLTVPTMPSGPYTIHIRGKIGAVDCWQNDDALQVPPQGKSLNETLTLAKTGASGC
jgi:hypothetical protein